MTGQLTNGAEAGLKEKSQSWREACACSAETRRAARSGGGRERVHERRLEVHESAKEQNRSRSERGGGRE